MRDDEHTLRASVSNGWALHPLWANRPAAASQPKGGPCLVANHVPIVLFVHHLRNCLPTDGEEGSLDAIGEDARSQTTAKQPGIALFLDDLLG